MTSSGTDAPSWLRPLERGELDLALDAAAAEGWNPGLSDAQAFWDADPGGHWAILDDVGEKVGYVSAVRYEGGYAFLGLFVMTADRRSQGIGGRAAEELLRRTRHAVGVAGCMAIDGVFERQDYYARLGFAFRHRNLRMAGVGRAGGQYDGVVPASALPFGEVVAYDAEHFGAMRPAFLHRWLAPDGGRAVAVAEGGGIRGLGVVRPCREGFKVGPLFASDVDVADRLYGALSSHAAGSPVFLDVPEVNDAALGLAARQGLVEVFGCARMELGSTRDIPWQRVFGVTTFELG